jgi:hypothetical protein
MIRQEHRTRLIQQAIDLGHTWTEKSDLADLVDAARAADIVVCAIPDPTEPDGYHLEFAKGGERFQAMMKDNSLGALTVLSVLCSSKAAAGQIKQALMHLPH